MIRDFIAMLQDWPFATRFFVGFIYSIFFGFIVAVGMAFYAYRKNMTKAERKAEDEILKNERNF